MSEPASTSELPRVRIVFTGGTISMRDDDGKGAVPVLKGEDLLREAPGIVQVCRPEINDFGQLPGPHMTPDRMMELASLVRSTIEADKADAIVITHGTDTLEETAYLLDLLHNTPHPVVFVGAMRTSSQPSWDGPVNLLDACRVAASQEARGLGVLVVMNSTVHAAGEVTKTYTEALDTFRAPDTGPLGIIDGDELVFSRRPTKRATLYVDRLEPKVGLVVASAGEDGRMIDHLAERGEFGIVVEALGRGNLPPAMARACERAIERGVVVALTSRCWGGRVRGVYGYDGGGARLKEAGLLFLPGLPGHKARILLMAALGAGMDSAEIEEWLKSAN